jgi:hypothetical protein
VKRLLVLGPGVVLVALVAWIGISRSRDRYGPDPLERTSKRTAGKASLDCGEVPVAGNPKAATECALAAQESGKPFRVRYDLRGIDAEVGVAIVRDPAGRVMALSWIGGPHACCVGHETVNREDCPLPIHLWVNPSGRINCFQKESSPPEYLSSPQAEPY